MGCNCKSGKNPINKKYMTEEERENEGVVKQNTIESVITLFSNIFLHIIILILIFIFVFPIALYALIMIFFGKKMSNGIAKKFNSYFNKNKMKFNNT